ncbi:hypothetical protein T07_37 [Trichinella nelsoni]|uniref:Uncharacterized protein n=1 Tax=Trichinella nelsoni TaxID=6336 RepID=A0A0V0SAC3_9BILA|nr:hypothetical protein T07_37 [Trichinella nelsoni]
MRQRSTMVVRQRSVNARTLETFNCRSLVRRRSCNSPDSVIALQFSKDTFSSWVQPWQIAFNASSVSHWRLPFKHKLDN